MIKEIRPLTMAEAKKISEGNGEKEEIKDYFKKFLKLKYKEADEMEKELKGLNNHKIKEEHIVKIVDLLPESASEINRIFTDVGLDEKEIKQIAEIAAKYK